MFEKNKLRKIFKKAAASSLAVVCFAWSAGCGDEPPSPPPTNDNSIPLCDVRNHTPEKAMPLTGGEVSLVRSIFGKVVNTAPERKYFLPGNPRYGAMTCQDGGKSLEFFGTGARPADYSHEGINNYGYFVHEMTHVWQFQTRGYTHCATYKYTLDTEHPFSSYCDEQQASIVEDYARHFLHPSHGATRNLLERGVPDNFNLLAKVVEDQFPEAKKPRLAREAKEKKKAAKPPQPNS